MDNRPIGVFDSGVGGLTVASEIKRLMPHESIVYAGDTARVPYGGKDKATLMQYGREIIRFLTQKQNAKAVVFACGTTSSNVFDELQAEFCDILLVDVIRPGVQAVADLSPKRVAFIATEATVRSGMFVRLLNQARPGIQVQARACPLFVPLIEEGWVNHKVTQLAAEAYLEDLKDTGLDALVLGCTHYPLLTDLLTAVLGDIRLINMAQYTVQALRDRLTQKDMLSADSARYTFFVSGYSDKFDQMARMILHEAYTAEKTSWV